MRDALFVLGDPPDPEMGCIETLLTDAGVSYIRLGQADDLRAWIEAWGTTVVAVELRPAALAALRSQAGDTKVVVIDHHDDHPAASLPPDRAVEASSVGQVLHLLALDQCRTCGDRLDWTDQSGSGWNPCRVHGPEDAYHSGPGLCDGGGGAPTLGLRDSGRRIPMLPCCHLHLWPLAPEEYAEIRLCAAADHCLAAAYRGEVPGVDPDVLGQWRAETRAAHQGRHVADVLNDVEVARAMLAHAPRIDLGGVQVADMRPGAGAPCGAHPVPPHVLAIHVADWLCDGALPDCWGDIPELPEAAARDGVAFIAIPRPGPDGRKLVLQAAPPPAVEAFLRGEGPAAGLVRRYGSPMRGLAGGYFA